MEGVYISKSWTYFMREGPGRLLHIPRNCALQCFKERLLFLGCRLPKRKKPASSHGQFIMIFWCMIELTNETSHEFLDSRSSDRRRKHQVLALSKIGSYFGYWTPGDYLSHFLLWSWFEWQYSTWETKTGYIDTCLTGFCFIAFLCYMLDISRYAFDTNIDMYRV